MKRVSAEILDLKTKNKAEYLFVRITVKAEDFYCIYSENGGRAFECLGNDFDEAKRKFEIFSDNEVSATHLADVLNDMRNEIFA